jgi:hypothetical protein
MEQVFSTSDVVRVAVSEGQTPCSAHLVEQGKESKEQQNNCAACIIGIYAMCKLLAPRFQYSDQWLSALTARYTCNQLSHTATRKRAIQSLRL